MSKKFATLNTVRGSSPPGDEGSDSDSEGNERQGFYVGGSESSGQEVLGPPGQRATPQELAERLFRAARANGADVVPPGEEAAASSKKPQPKGGRRLGTEGEPSNAPQEEVVLGDDEDTVPQRIVRLHIWQNGFSVDDGPLRDPREPQNAEFLQAIATGRVPTEIYRMYPRERIDLHMERKPTDYVAPKSKPFAGGGQRLGADVGAGSSSSSSQPIPVVTSAPAAKLAEAVSDAVRTAQEELLVKKSEPVTRLQIRLPGGRPVLTVQLNHTHTIADIRNFVVTAVPELAYSPFQFQTAYPIQVLNDESQSVEAANLLNSLIVVKQSA